MAFAVAHLRESARQDPRLLYRLAQSVHRRHDTLRHTAGLNQEVHDALVLMAAGSWELEDLRGGQPSVFPSSCWTWTPVGGGTFR